MAKNRGKNLDDRIIELIVGVLDGWVGKLTWDLLTEAIEERMRIRYTRQALDKHARIKAAFQLTKERLSGTPRSERKLRLSEAEIEVLTQRYERMQAENVRLKHENNRLLEQYQTWLYNAHLKGLTKDYLDSPLPCVDREQTKLSSTPMKLGARKY